MAVTAAMVKELRERTGAGMMECKKALVETDADIDAAVEHLRMSGQAKADKKAGRVAADGQVVIAQSGSTAVVVEINSETDFVAKDDNFGAFVDAVSQAILGADPADLEAVKTLELADGRSVEEARTELVAKVGENISIRRFRRISGAESIASYSHGGRIAAAVAFTGGDNTFGRDVAMHVSASNPVCIGESDVPAETLESERRILTEQAQSSGKPPEIIEKMVEGRVKKFLSEITLLGQPFVKDPDITVAKLAKSAGAEIQEIVRFEVGEGLEKKEENFADEVMQQIQAAKDQDAKK